MTLRLVVISYKGTRLTDNVVAEFNQSGGAIGRKKENTLVLGDPENFVSGRHAEILYNNGQYQLKDISKNGTYLVNANVQLNGESITLNDKEVLRIGEYEVLVEIDSDPADISAIDFSEFDRGPFSQAIMTEAGAPFGTESVSVGLEKLPEDTDRQFPPSQAFQDSFSVPNVLMENSAPPVQPAKDIAQFLKGLDALEDPRPFDIPVVNGAASIDKRFAVENFPQDVSPLSGIELTEQADRIAPELPQASSVSRDRQEEVSSVNASHPGAIDNSELLKCFLQGAGISDTDFLQESQRRQAMISAGQLFRNLIEGLMDVLRARAEMKSEFRVSVTTIRSTENNPLKFNPDVESVLKLMLSPNNPAFISPDVAVAEAFRDIKYHQMAITAGIQASLAEMMRRFEPDTFEKTLGEGLVFQKKARCWELYCEKYPELKSLAVNEFFGDEFADAYEKQMNLFSRR
ncbi:type VI secretion system-associated FHA domain protein TagH [Methylomonas sp. EFPC3]|uniref:type VI secretion system-associated FHA domain protein TagH n=1 Tax=Methylomonas sp. EFPC3 TaxID=3021710 RepID=UPI002415FD27|nr:type VI secretion system-associated FHA domain protein TagH [Methylomonas sp. EFPC3]WFP49015.1 type VI secretion system-associated FHA domain protein TagH [Methylomonas sp. EFPC3]